MNIVTSKKLVSEITRLNPFDRFEDGRPHVPEDLIQRMKKFTIEEVWAVLRKHGYHRQFESGWFQTHPDKVLVGRCVTAMMLPHRPDLHDLVQETGKNDGRIGGQNSWVIDTLVEGDVLIVDMFGKVKDGTFIGDNLGTSIMTRTKRGAVLDCGIRDYPGISKMEEVSIFCRGVDPTAIADVTLAGVNMPIRIGGVTVLPGDVVLGTSTGVIFVPPHLVQEVVETAEDVQSRDKWSKIVLGQGKYTPGEIDVANWIEHIEADYQAWLKSQ